MNKILRWIALGAIFVVPLAPLVVAGSFGVPSMFFPFITAKNFLFRVAVEVGLGAWLILMLRDRRYLPKKSWFLWALAALLAVMCLADLGSENVAKSFWSNFERMEGYVTLLHLAGYFLLASTMLGVERFWGRFAATTLGASLIVSFYGFGQLLGWYPIHQGSTRLDASLGNSAYLAVYLLFHLFLFVFLAVRYLKRVDGRDFIPAIPILYAAGALFEGVIIYYTATRGALIGLALALFVISVLFAWKERHKVLRGAAIAVIALIVLAVGALFVGRSSRFVSDSQVLQRFSALATTNVGQILATEGKSRVDIWTMALKGVAERPILGWGQESFNYLFYKYYNPNMYAQEPWFDRAHDVVLDWLVTGGVLGLISYLSLFAAAIWYMAVRQPEEGGLSFAERAIIGGALIAYFVHNLFVFDNISSYILFFSLLAYLHSIYGKPLSKAVGDRLASLPSWGSASIAVAVAVLSLGSVGYVNAKGYEVATGLVGALTEQPSGAAANLAIYENLLALHSFGQSEVREYLSQFAIQASQASSVDQQTLSDIFSAAYGEMQKQLQETPNDVRYYYFMEHLLLAYGQNQQALPVIEKAVSLSPKKQMLLFDQGMDMIETGNKDGALAVFKQAYDLDHGYSDALVYYAMAAIFDGKMSLADSLLVPAYGTDEVSDSRILLAYTQTGQYDKAIGAIQRQIAQDPSNGQTYSLLASVYLQMGDKADAIKALEKAGEVDPLLKTAADAAIKQIQAAKAK